MDPASMTSHPTFTGKGAREISLEGNRETSAWSSQQPYLCCIVVFCLMICLGGKQKQWEMLLLLLELQIRNDSISQQPGMSPPLSTAITCIRSYNALSIQIYLSSQTIKFSLAYEGCLGYQILIKLSLLWEATELTDGCPYNPFDPRVRWHSLCSSMS